MFGRCAGMLDSASIMRPSVCVQVMSPGTCPLHSNMGESTPRNLRQQSLHTVAVGFAKWAGMICFIRFVTQEYQMQPGWHLSARETLAAGGTWYARNRSLQPRSDSSASYRRCLTRGTCTRANPCTMPPQWRRGNCASCRSCTGRACGVVHNVQPLVTKKYLLTR